MRLSEAIRLGATLGPQGRKLGEHPVAGTCALEAASLALGGGRNYGERLHPVYGELLRRVVFIPQREWPLMIEHAIYHLNDYHLWTREQIADWVETIENELIAKGVDVGQEQENKHDETTGAEAGNSELHAGALHG